MGTRGVPLAITAAVLLFVSWLGWRYATQPLRSPGDAAAVSGVTDTEISFGISAVFSGPARELGLQVQRGIRTCFEDVNARGGINGRKIVLISKDDGYEPERAARNVTQMLDKKEVFGVIGNVGTPTAAATLPIITKHQTLFYGAMTGSNLLRTVPPDHHVFNFRASYAEETAAAVRYLLTKHNIAPGQIAVFAQEDRFGDDGYEGVIKAIRTSGCWSQPLRVGYRRNSDDVAKAVAKILENRDKIRAVAMISTYRAASRFIKAIRDAKLPVIFTNVSFVGSRALLEELMQMSPLYAKGVIVTQVVPHFDSKLPLVLTYRELLGRYFPAEHPDFISLEGFVAARILVDAIRRAGRDLTTDAVISCLERLPERDIGLGTDISFSPSEHQATHKVWGTMLTDTGRYEEIDIGT